MADDIDFDMFASDIMEQTTAIRDVQLVLTVEKWVLKLTAGYRGPNELNYLRLLQLMVNNRRIGPPFVRAPPQGFLLPLSRYINPQQCDRTPPRVRPDRCNNTKDDGPWRVTLASKYVQTAGFEEQYYEDEAERLQQDIDPKNDGDDKTVTSRQTTQTDDKTDDKTDVTDVKAKEADDKTKGSEDERDGHLAGGGGEHWYNVQGNQLVKLCNPCLEKMGRHLKKPITGPMGRDCAHSVLSEYELKSVDPELLHVVQNINDYTTLNDFYFQVCTYLR